MGRGLPSVTVSQLGEDRLAGGLRKVIGGRRRPTESRWIICGRNIHRRESQCIDLKRGDIARVVTGDRMKVMVRLICRHAHV